MATMVSIGFSQLSKSNKASRNQNIGPHREAKRAKFLADTCGLSGGRLARYSQGGSVPSAARMAAETITFWICSDVVVPLFKVVESDRKVDGELFLKGHFGTRASQPWWHTWLQSRIDEYRAEIEIADASRYLCT